MDVLLLFLLIVAFVVFLVLYAKFFSSISVDRYEYLALLSFINWRRARNLREEMGRRAERRIRVQGFYDALCDLESEGLVESCCLVESCDETGATRQGGNGERSYRLTQEGVRAKDELTDPTGRLRTIRRTGITHKPQQDY